MTSRPPPDVERVLAAGSFCHVAAETPNGPHLTPLVFVYSGRRLWLTTSRGSVKARAWRHDPRVAGMVRDGKLAVSFVGEVRTHDVLDPVTWVPSLVAAPAISTAAARFTRKNARFFAGYAVDARDVPFAWTPPGRVFAEVRMDRAALLEDDGVVELWGDWDREVASHGAFRASRKGEEALAGLPVDVAERVGREGRGALAVEGGDGPVVVPAGWVAEETALYAALPASVLELADAPEPDTPVALAVDHASWWRAKHMTGAMIQGRGSTYVLDRLGSGTGSAASRVEAAGVDPGGAALVRIVPRRLVWWRGWSSGTVVPP